MDGGDLHFFVGLDDVFSLVDERLDQLGRVFIGFGAQVEGLDFFERRFRQALVFEGIDVFPFGLVVVVLCRGHFSGKRLMMKAIEERKRQNGEESWKQEFSH